MSQENLPLQSVENISETKIQSPSQPTSQDRQISTNINTATAIFAQTEPQEKLIDLIQGLDAIVWEMDVTNWRFKFVSIRAEEILGYPISQWYEEPTFWQNRLIHPEDRDHSINYCLNQTKQGKDHTIEYRAITADGRTIWLKEIARVVCDSNQTPKLLRGLMLDITKEKQAQKQSQELIQERAAKQQIQTIQLALTKSEQRYRCLVEAISEITWSTTDQGAFITEQPAWSAYTGQTLEQYLGWGWLNAIHPEDRQHTAKIWTHALTQRTLYEAEYRLLRHDGQYRYTNARGVPVTEPDGSIREWVGINIDIHERKQVQQALQKALTEAQAARNELQRVFTQAPAAISTTRGPNHIIETANPVYLKMVGNRAVIGKPAREAFPEIEGQGFFEYLDQVYTTGQPYIGKEMRSLLDHNSDGIIEECYWNLVYQPLFDSNAQVYGIMAHAIEVTEQVKTRQEIEKKAEELTRLSQALEHTNKELEQFAYIASHDLKAPLRGIANLAEWIEEDLTDVLTEESREHMNLLRGRVQQMSSLINGILEYSRAGRSQATQLFNVEELLIEIIELITPPPQVTITIDPQMPTLETEKIPLQQVFMNLIGNAIKYAKKTDVHVQISVQKQTSYYQFSVTDNGPGIAKEYQNKIWGIFQRLESRDKIEGAGIGLAVVKKIIESRGGQIWLESQLGSGSSFRFLWPQ